MYNISTQKQMKNYNKVEYVLFKSQYEKLIVRPWKKITFWIWRWTASRHHIFIFHMFSNAPLCTLKGFVVIFAKNVHSCVSAALFARAKINSNACVVSHIIENEKGSPRIYSKWKKNLTEKNYKHTLFRSKCITGPVNNIAELSALTYTRRRSRQKPLMKMSTYFQL